MRVGSLFSGIGGLDRGLELAGMEVIWQVENDPYCNRVLEKHWPEVQRYGDIKEIDWAGVERPDLVCGGFPCPIVSSAARGRNNGEWLWPEFARAVGDLQPDYALVENVEGLLRNRLWEILGDLASLGYVSEWATLPASAFGAPHKRTRVWLVAHANSKGQSRRAFDAKMAVLPKPDLAYWARSNPAEYLRVDDGAPHRVDRLRALGNAVVPQVAEWIGRQILNQTDRQTSPSPSTRPASTDHHR
jgi:DNA (cytosine-5)-methyltransferase 1